MFILFYPKRMFLLQTILLIYYDYILMPEKDVLLFPFDYQDYIRNSRDLAYDYLTYTPGVKSLEFLMIYYETIKRR